MKFLMSLYITFLLVGSTTTAFGLNPNQMTEDQQLHFCLKGSFSDIRKHYDKCKNYLSAFQMGFSQGREMGENDLKVFLFLGMPPNAPILRETPHKILKRIRKTFSTCPPEEITPDQLREVVDLYFQENSISKYNRFFYLYARRPLKKAFPCSKKNDE